MRRTAMLCLLLALFLAGCNGERRRVSREANSLTAAYAVKMENGQTTADQDRRFIRAMSKVCLELDRSIRGDKKANQTRKAAEKLAGVGLDHDSNFNLDEDGDSGDADEGPEGEADISMADSEDTIVEIEGLASDIATKLKEKRDAD